ncbi:disease resistance protein RPM1-like [Camellia sinensis]|nr:disease resistance protein RPM1-like [Camellia sinensis]
MAESAVSSVIQFLGTLLVDEVVLLSGVHEEISYFRDELVRMQCFLKDADSRVAGGESVKIYVKQLIEVAYWIKDIFNEHILVLAKHPRRFGFFISFFRKVTRWITVLKQQHKIASQIKDIKVRIHEIMGRHARHGLTTFLEHNNHSSSITGKWWHDPQVGSLYIEDDEIVGIESPKYELIGRLLAQEDQSQAVISVVGMGGIGKTTLAMKVYDSQEVVAHFNCKAWITVSQSYDLKELLQTMIKQLSGIYVPPDEGIESLIVKLRGYLSEKRYVIVFDDVWETDFWGSIRHALPKNSRGSRVIITTRNEQVATFCKETSMDHVHELEALSEEKAWELFCKKAFRQDFGVCPPELEKVSLKIVRKCEGLPLAIVVISGLLSLKMKVISEWQEFYDGLRFELEKNYHLTILKRILLLSYQDLPCHLKSCLLYLGIIPEKYSITRGRLIRLWIAERLVPEKEGRTLEEVAEAYLNELIQRRLLQVSESKLYGRVVTEFRVHYALKHCRVHLLLHELILSMSEEFSFCQLLTDENSSFNGRTRRLSMHMHYYSMEKVMESIGKSPVHSFFLFEVGKLPKKPLLGTLAAKFKLLNVLDLEGAPLDQLHKEVGNLYFLRYLSVRRTGVQIIPKSIGNLHNLLTLDLKYSPVSELPIDINKLHKLRHLLAYYHNYGCANIVDIVRGVRIQGGIGQLQELQKLWHVEINHDDGLSLIEELGNLMQLRKLGITKLKREHGRALCATIEKMNYLKYLKVAALSDDEILDLQYISSPPQYLQCLNLGGRLEKLPDWIPKLQNLVKLSLLHSGLTNDPLKALQVLPSLEHLHLWNACDGEQLYFEVGSFQKLEQLDLLELEGLNSVIIEEGALPLLKELRIGPIPQLKEVPSGIHHLQKLKTLAFIDMPKEFLDTLQPQPNQSKDYWIVEHIPNVLFWSRWGFSGYWNSGTLQKYFERKVKNQRVTEAE